MKTVSLFGATGSIGESTKDVILSAPGKFDVKIVTAYRNVQKLVETAKALKADQAIIGDKTAFGNLKEALGGTDIECRAGRQALIDAAVQQSDLTIMAIMGFAGLEPLMTAIQRGGIIAIANKEPLVVAGPLVMKEAQKCRATLLPIDSEHNAIFQVLEEENRAHIARIILTASGGPFREYSTEQMKEITVEEALNHPTWDMGAKISIDSATMANKALEIIEAHYLFNLPPEKISVLVHPQSIIHSMVEYEDGSVLSQMGASDMRTPISHVMAWPKRMITPGKRLDFMAMNQLDFEKPDTKRFPFIGIAYDCLKEGLHKNIAFNASNEVAVDFFLNKSLSFLDIIRVVRHITESAPDHGLAALNEIIDYDQAIRKQTVAFIEGL